MIILGITGSIAAYKAIELAKLLISNSYEINIIISKTAENFVSLLTLKTLFPGRVFCDQNHLSKQDEILHIKLAKQAKVILIAPASANIIAKLAHGFADCLLTSTILASEAQIVLAPAMNKIMWQNLVVQKNISLLNHCKILGPAKGLQACGDDGLGRMLEPLEIFEFIKNFNVKPIFKGKKILITAGPTIEKIDPVRFLSNFSSGKMGYALAKLAYFMGAEVTLITGPCNEQAFPGIKLIQIESALEMLDQVINCAPNHDIFISSAAVADYKIKDYTEQKLKKRDSEISLTLVKTPDILKHVRSKFPNLFMVGFAAETENTLENGKIKLLSKQLDLIAINDVSGGQVFGKNENQLQIINKNLEQYFIEKNSKDKVAQQLLEIISHELP